MTEEIFDITDNNDNVIGQAARSVVHAQGWWHRGVHIFLFTSDGRMLVQQRSADRKQYASLWDCSVSEHVKAGEDYVTAAQRGLWEELGLRDVTLTPRLRFRLNYGPNDNEISVLFTGTVDPARVRFDPVEIARLDYHSLGELQKIMDDRTLPLSRWFVQMLLWWFDQPSEIKIIETYAKPR
jgi:isopentenyl-diphosphate delta-isomerase type 1